MDDAARVEAGLGIRRAVLGGDYVDARIAATTDFTQDYQDLINRYAWGDIWARPGLDHQTRRLLVLAFTIALNRGEEFKLHLRAAIEHGVPLDLIKEVLLQSAIYCGVPAANTAFTLAQDIVDEQRATAGR